MSDKRVVVVGTTADYIDIISTRFPGRALFVTDHRERAAAVESPPDSASEVLCDLSDFEEVGSALRLQLMRWRIKPIGIACFDCESMSLAAYLADLYELPYPGAGAIAAARDKCRSKQLWRGCGLPTPAVRTGQELSDAVSFMAETGGPVVLKPTTGSGSELVFVCHNRDELSHAFATMTVRLENHSNARMYPRDAVGRIAMEEYVAGEEYSCDFVLDGNRVDIIRIARKVFAAGHTVGTTLAYVVPSDLPEGLERSALADQFKRAAMALGIDRAVCMIDFIVRDGQAVMLELTPRPGGDCLPPLIRLSGGLDMLGLTLDFAEGIYPALPPPSRWRRLVGARIIAGQAGMVRQIDSRHAMADSRVIEVYLKRRPGHEVVLPPEDYDSRILGHVIFAPSATTAVEVEANELIGMVRVDMEAPRWATPQALS